MDLTGRIGWHVTEETGGSRLTEITGAGINFAGPRSAVGEFEGDARSNGGGIARGPAQLYSQRMSSTYALVRKARPVELFRVTTKSGQPS